MKRRIVLIIGYSGKNFHGSQHNQELPTIELEIVNSLLKINAIKEINAKFPQKIGLQRGSRTDKGVHAAMAVITAKVEKEINERDLGTMKEYLKEKNIHLYKIIRVTKNFIPKNACNSRVYEYLLPTFILENNNREYRITKEDSDFLNSLFQKFIGTYDFRNFTTNDNERGTIRYIKHINTSEKVYKNNIEYVKISIQGNSFMLHQIRKMVGFIVSIFRFSRENADNVFAIAFSKDKNSRINIPKAPSEFLFLDRPIFDYFNERAMYGKIEVDEGERNKIKTEIIYPEILKEENLLSFEAWFDIFEKHSYEFGYLTSEKKNLEI